MPEISANMTLLEIAQLHPETEAIFRQYEQITGSCLLCNNLFDSLSSMAAQYSLKLDELLRHLQTSNE
jgi:hypothetical protein